MPSVDLLTSFELVARFLRGLVGESEKDDEEDFCPSPEHPSEVTP